VWLDVDGVATLCYLSAGGDLNDDDVGVVGAAEARDPEFVPEDREGGGYDSEQDMGVLAAAVAKQPKPRKVVDEHWDPYAPLDPDDAGDAAAVRPFKKGGTYKRPGAGGSKKVHANRSQPMYY
jgi:hypothetical protein